YRRDLFRKHSRISLLTIFFQVVPKVFLHQVYVPEIRIEIARPSWWPLKSPNEQPDQVMIASSKSEPTAHLHQRVGCTRCAPIVASRQPLDCISTRELVTAD